MQIIVSLAEKLPKMTERERGYLEGTIATAAAMSELKKEIITKKEVLGEYSEKKGGEQVQVRTHNSLSKEAMI